MDNKNPTSQVCLAILPLQVLDDNPQVAIYCQGLVMDLITDLSRFRNFSIISHNTSRTWQPDEQTDSPRLEEARLDYLVKGMLRCTNNQILLNLQLVNVQENRLVWAEKFSGPLNDFFRIEEEIVEDRHVAAALCRL